jgi:hypothetical protein
VGLCAGRLPRHGKLAALHRGFRPAEASTGKHRIGQIWRRAETRHADVETLRPYHGDRHKGDPQHQIEALLDPGRGRRQRLTSAIEITRSYRKAGAIAAEHERKLTSLQRVGGRRDHRRAGHVDRLVTLCRDRLGRFHDIGDADTPVVRQRRIKRRVHQLGKPAKDRNAAVECVAGSGH